MYYSAGNLRIRAGANAHAQATQTVSVSRIIMVRLILQTYYNDYIQNQKMTNCQVIYITHFQHNLFAIGN